MTARGAIESKESSPSVIGSWMANVTNDRFMWIGQKRGTLLSMICWKKEQRIKENQKYVIKRLNIQDHWSSDAYKKSRSKQSALRRSYLNG